MKDMQKLVKGGGEGVTWSTFEILGPRNVKFGMHIHHQEYLRNKCKIRSKGSGRGHV